MSVAEFQGLGIVVTVHGSVLDTWHQSKQLDEKATEQFGVLIGSKSDKSNMMFWVETCSSPQPTDVSKRFSFTLQDPYHQKLVDQEFTLSRGESGYIGTWHTHPERVPTPSQTDLTDWQKCIVRNSDRQLFFAIIGTHKTVMFTSDQGKIVALKRTN